MAINRDNSTTTAFLRDLWQDKTRRERGEKTFEQKAIDIFLSIRVTLDKNPRPDLVRQLKTVERAILRYAETIANLSRVRLECDALKERAEIENADQNRRFAHNCLVSDVGILARWFKEAGLDNSWQNSIGLSREEIADWAFAVAPFLKDKILKEKEEVI